MIYKKIKKARTAFQMNAIAAAQAGAKGTNIKLVGDLNEKEEDGITKVSNPITYRSSPAKLDPDKEKLLGKYNLNGRTGSLYSSTSNYKSPDHVENKTLDFLGSQDFQSAFGDARKAGLSTFDFQGKPYTTNLFQDVQRGAAGVSGSEENKRFAPDPDTEVPASQRYNMGNAEATNMNYARNTMRRGLNRDERKDIKNTVQGMSNADRKNFKQEMKKQRKGTFLGLGLGGDRQERKIKALKQVGLESGKEFIDPNYKSYKSEIASRNLKGNTEQRNKKIENVTQDKYGSPKGKYFDFKEASTESSFDSSLPNINNEDLATVLRNDDGSVMSPRQKEEFLAAKNAGGPPKKGYKGKQSKSMKARFGKGAGYNS